MRLSGCAAAVPDMIVCLSDSYRPDRFLHSHSFVGSEVELSVCNALSSSTDHRRQNSVCTSDTDSTQQSLLRISAAFSTTISKDKPKCGIKSR